MTAPSPPPPEGTRQALILAGLKLFGRQSFAATSIRQLAAEADANVAAIAYHFGGKDGLRLACAQEFGRRMGAAMDLARIADDPGPVEARMALRGVMRAMVDFLLGADGVSAFVPFMLRELAEDGPGVDLVYQGFARPSHERLCQLWARATGAKADDDAVRLAVFTLIGQVMYFRVGQSIVTRRMGWDDIGPVEIGQIADRILRNLDAMLNQDMGA